MHSNIAFHRGALHLQIKDEACMEDLNNLLNGGEVPNLFPPDERLQVSSRPGTLSAPTLQSPT